MRKLNEAHKRWGVPMRCSLSVVILTTLLSGCASTTFRYACPPLTKYSEKFQDQTAVELPKAGSNVKQLVSDYGQLRDACRAMEAK